MQTVKQVLTVGFEKVYAEIVLEFDVAEIPNLSPV